MFLYYSLDLDINSKFSASHPIYYCPKSFSSENHRNRETFRKNKNRNFFFSLKVVELNEIEAVNFSLYLL